MSLFRAVIAFTLIAFASPVAAQETFDYVAIDAPRQTGAIDLGTVAVGAPNREQWMVQNGILGVRNVTVPTLTPVLPAGPSTGVAMIVAPGGAFLGLAMRHEGWDVARWLANHGIAAFVLKYRVLPTPVDSDVFRSENDRMRAGEAVSFAPPQNTPAPALEDGLAALRYVREHAAEFGIDPHRVGFMGFSAGGYLTRSVVEHGGVDAPNFAAPIYPNMAAMVVPADAPPMFVTIAADDFLLLPHDGFPLVDSYRAAGKPIEFHLLTSGGHGFGLGNTGTPSEGWAETLLRWMHDIGVMEDRD